MPPSNPLAYAGTGAGGAPPGGGAALPRPPAGGQQPNPAMALGALEGNRSPFNPTDVAVGGSRFAGVSEQTPLRDLLPMLGLDLDAPGIPQIKRMAQGGIQGIDTLGKMPAIARGQNAMTRPPQGAAAAPPPGGVPPAAGPQGPPTGAPTGAGGGGITSISDLTRTLGG